MIANANNETTTTPQAVTLDNYTGRALVVAYGLGVDSTAMLVGMVRRGIRPDAILFADVGAEKKATYDFLPIMQRYLAAHGFPQVTTVRNPAPRSPYDTIEGNMVQNATLPGATFGRGSCTLKWKIDPQNKWTAKSDICRAAWDNGEQVLKLIGFDATEGYRKSRAADKAHGKGDDKYAYATPLISWGWNRDRCKAEIAAEGLPVPPKSSCIFCPNCKPAELHDLTPSERGRIVRVEIAAEPYNRKVYGLWRRPRKADGRPGSITEYLVDNDIDFTMPTDPQPLNPNCQKFKNGCTFHGPHNAVNLGDLVDNHLATKAQAAALETAAHNATIEAL